MAAFSTLNWGDLDCFAILVGDGIASVEPNFAERSLAWARSRSYSVQSLDFGSGIGPVVAMLGKQFRWREQFGYELEATDRILPRLRDGFWFDVSLDGGLVLELRNFETAFAEDGEWSTGFLAIASEHSHRQLALGHRFFTLVHVASEDSRIVGLETGKKCVPYPYVFPRREPDA